MVMYEIIGGLVLALLLVLGMLWLTQHLRLKQQEDRDDPTESIVEGAEQLKDLYRRKEQK